MDGGLARGDVLHVPQRQVGPLIHPTQASLRRFYAKHIQPPPTPVHSRDAPCVRPAALCASCRLACILPLCVPRAIVAPSAVLDSSGYYFSSLLNRRVFPGQKLQPWTCGIWFSMYVCQNGWKTHRICALAATHARFF